ncbi:Y-family DNA polymerase, partial [bacterium]|nr:Y-family DNA polymerase [bacterium]
MSCIALVDCNNFFVSCERIFRPDLACKPVVVLSNNDGCVIARSNEAKNLGIKMGEPYFKCRDLIVANKVTVFSSNFVLYADISNRIMSIIRRFVPKIEVYSIDEAFLDLSFVEPAARNTFVRQLRETIYKWLGIRVSVSVAPTKTLAKLANNLIKKNPCYHGVLNLGGVSESSLQKFFKQSSLNQVWGLGPQSVSKLEALGVFSVLDFVAKDLKWIKQHSGLNIMKTYLELKAQVCYELEQGPVAKKSIVRSKSFAKTVSNLENLQLAVSNHAAQIARALRKQNSQANVIGVFVRNSPFSKSEVYYSNKACTGLLEASNNSFELIKAAKGILNKLYKKSVNYKKVGVFVSDLVSADRLQ